MRQQIGTPAKVEALETMLRAKQSLTDGHRWVKTWPDHGQHCALTAINVAAGNGLNDHHHGTVAECMVLHEANERRERKKEFTTIPQWNDTRETTKKKVLGVFTTVINKLYNSLPAKERKKWKDKI
jgi:hypothetical protein